MYFNRSIEIGEELNDPYHLAKVHTAMGKVFSRRKAFDQAIKHLSKGFELDENIANIRGLRIVTPSLTFALSQLGQQKKSLEYCNRALQVAPDHPGFLELREIVRTGTHKILIKTGVVISIHRNRRDGREGEGGGGGEGGAGEGGGERGGEGGEKG
jgi:tetratricopeptide (TPR) repeat protein